MGNKFEMQVLSLFKAKMRYQDVRDIVSPRRALLVSDF